MGDGLKKQLRIVDGFLPIDDWTRATDELLKDRWSFPPEGNHKHSRTKVWRVFDAAVIEELTRILVPRIEDAFALQGFTVKRVGVNGATPMIESHMHVDGPPGDMTVVWMANRDWHPLFGGELLLFRDEDAWRAPGDTKQPDPTKGISKIEFTPNRAVLFPSHLVHFPNSPHPRAAHRLRMTVGVHLAAPKQKQNG
jgi:hypothetical protein